MRRAINAESRWIMCDIRAKTSRECGVAGLAGMVKKRLNAIRLPEISLEAGAGIADCRWESYGQILNTAIPPAPVTLGLQKVEAGSPK